MDKKEANKKKKNAAIVKKNSKIDKKIYDTDSKKINNKKKNISEKKNNKNGKEHKLIKYLKKIFIDSDYTYSFSEVIVITIVSMIVGAFTFFSLVMIISGGRNYFTLSKEMNKFYDIFYTLKDNAYDDVTDKDLIEAGIKGMVESVGDTYTSYMDVSDTDDFEKNVGGYYEGIGCTISKLDDRIEVIEVLKDSPALKAGMLVGDIFKKVDDIEINDETMPADISDYIMNKATGEITLVVLRGEKEISIKLKKGKVPEQVIASKIIENDGYKVGYLGITLFSTYASDQFKDKLNDLNQKGIDALIIDVRGNNGGFLTTVKGIASELVSSGKKLYQVEKNGKIQTTIDKTKESVDYPVAILVNGGSASASEILAAVVKESMDNSFVVGTKTFGKGTVQQTKKLKDGSMIKYTVERWLTPNGNSINGVGVEPTDIVEFDYEGYEQSGYISDNQLDKALELVIGKISNK